MTTVVGFDQFAENVAAAIGAGMVKVERRIFPDGEVCPRLLGDVSGDIILVNRMSLPLDPNGYLAETLLLLRMLAPGAARIDVVMPYFVYGRQDRVFREGEPFSAKSVLELLQLAGAARVFVVSSHAEREHERLSFSPVPAYNVNGFTAIGRHLKAMNLEKPLVIGPDRGAQGFVETVASIVGCETALFEKKRNLETGEIVMHHSLNLRGRDVVIVDDIVGSGGTMLKAIELCAGARHVYAAVVHLVSDMRVRELQSRTAQFLVCNTIAHPQYASLAKVGVEQLVAETIQNAGGR